MAWESSKRRAHVPSGWEQQRTARRILARDGRRCYRCGAPATEVDHVIPLGEGGRDEDPNRRAICPPCHRRKTAAEAARARARLPHKGGAAGTIRRPPPPHPGLR